VAREVAVLAHADVRIADRSDAHPAQPDDGVADGLAHVADLACAPLVQDDRQERLVLARAEPLLHERHVGRRRPPAFDHHAPAQPPDGILIGDAPHAYVVFALDLVPRVHQPLGELAVVRQEQQPLGVVVQAPDGVDVRAHFRQELEHRVAVLGVLARRHVAARLVEQDVAAARGDADALAVDADVVGPGIGFRAEFEDRLAVDRDAALCDEGFGGAAGRDARGREDLLEAVACCLRRHGYRLQENRSGLTAHGGTLARELDVESRCRVYAVSRYRSRGRADSDPCDPSDAGVAAA